MKKLVWNGLFIFNLLLIFLAVIQEKWLVAISLTLLAIFIELDQIHDTIKAIRARSNT